jgi:hypothetical protein
MCVEREGARLTFKCRDDNCVSHMQIGIANPECLVIEVIFIAGK